MATQLDKPITRETTVVYQTRPVLITLRPRGVDSVSADDLIEFRLKGTQQKIRITIENVFRYARQRAIAAGRNS